MQIEVYYEAIVSCEMPLTLFDRDAEVSEIENNICSDTEYNDSDQDEIVDLQSIGSSKMRK